MVPVRWRQIPERPKRDLIKEICKDRQSSFDSISLPLGSPISALLKASVAFGPWSGTDIEDSTLLEVLLKIDPVLNQT